MTRKDYILLARALNSAKPVKKDEDDSPMLKTALTAWSWAVEKVADALASDNLRFDREKFYQAVDMQFIWVLVKPDGSRYGTVSYSSQEGAEIAAQQIDRVLGGVNPAYPQITVRREVL